MLRIDRTENGQIVLKLSGRIEREQVAELETLIHSETRGREIVLDLKDVTLVGPDGIAFLEQCESDKITLVNCAPYIHEWINKQRGGKKPTSS